MSVIPKNQGWRSRLGAELQSLDPRDFLTCSIDLTSEMKIHVVKCPCVWKLVLVKATIAGSRELLLFDLGLQFPLTQSSGLVVFYREFDGWVQRTESQFVRTSNTTKCGWFAAKWLSNYLKRKHFSNGILDFLDDQHCLNFVLVLNVFTNWLKFSNPPYAVVLSIIHLICCRVWLLDSRTEFPSLAATDYQNG